MKLTRLLTSFMDNCSSFFGSNIKIKEKAGIWIPLFILIGILLMLSNSCKKDNNSNPEGTVTDIDGNIYHTVQIGTQVWMAENLKTTKLNDGTSIPLVKENGTWAYLSTPGYCWYNNDEATFKNTYGALYNFNAVNTGKLSPTGWHVPTDAEWTILSNFLGGEDVAGGKMKEEGTTHWNSPSTNGTNERGFTALPVGFRRSDGYFFSIGANANFWSPLENSPSPECYRYLVLNNSNLNHLGISSNYGFSVRCLKD